MIPQINFERKRERVEISHSISAQCTKYVTFLSRVVTLVKAWLHFYDPER